MLQRRGMIGAFALVLGVACASAPKSFRQPVSPYADAWLEWTDAGRPLLRISVVVPQHEWSAAGEPGAPQLLTVTAVLRDDKGRPVVSHSWPMELPQRDARRRGALQHETEVAIPQAGDVDLELSILLRGRILLAGWRRHWNIAAIPPTTPCLNEAVFLDADGAVSVSRVYGEHDEVRLRSGLYVPQGLDSTQVPDRVDWSIRAGETKQAEGSVPLTAAAGRLTSFELAFPRLAPGVYGVVLQVPAVPHARVTEGWQIVPQIDTWGDSLPATEVLEVVLSSADFARLQESSGAQRLQVWRQALLRLQPGSLSAALEEVARRWQEASARFVEPQLPGWRTDRGRVYIRRGDPDEIDVLRDPDTAQRVERWRYRQGNLVFVFLDTTGAGTFILERTNDPDFP